MESPAKKHDEVFTGKLYTLAEVYQQAAALSQINGTDVHVNLVFGKPDAFDNQVFPCCGGCIHFAADDFLDDDPLAGEYGNCMRYPQGIRVEEMNRCGEYLGGAIFSSWLLEKIGGGR